MKQVERGRGRPALPVDEVLSAQVKVRLCEADDALLDALAAALDTDRASAMRAALRALAARKVRS